jgi:hypothetical protein
MPNPKGGLFWIFGLSALLMMGKGNARAQEIISSNDSPCLTENPIDAGGPDSAESHENIALDSIGLDSVLLLPDEEIFKAIGATRDLLDIDSIMNLPPQDVRQEVRKAAQRPPRIEIQEVKIRAPENIDWNDTDYTSTLANAIFIEAFNLIRLRVFVPDTALAANADPDYLALIKAVNRETKYALVHELAHAAETGFILAGLNFDQLVQNSIHCEIITRLKEMLARRSVFLATNDMSAAFPRACFFANKDSLNKTESHEYIEWLKTHADLRPDTISAAEADAILESVLRNADREFMFYLNDGQFVDVTKAGMLKAARQQRSYLRHPDISQVWTFDELTGRRYATRFGNFLDLISAGMRAAFLNVLREFAHNKDLQDSLADLRARFDKEFKSDSEAFRKKTGTNKKQEFDTANRMPAIPAAKER